MLEATGASEAVRNGRELTGTDGARNDGATGACDRRNPKPMAGAGTKMSRRAIFTFPFPPVGLLSAPAIVGLVVPAAPMTGLARNMLAFEAKSGGEAGTFGRRKPNPLAGTAVRTALPGRCASSLPCRRAIDGTTERSLAAPLISGAGLAWTEPPRRTVLGRIPSAGFLELAESKEFAPGRVAFRAGAPSILALPHQPTEVPSQPVRRQIPTKWNREQIRGERGCSVLAMIF